MAKRKPADATDGAAPVEEQTADIKEQNQRHADYAKLLNKVYAVKAMTDTDAWTALFSAIQGEIAQHSRDILHAEKPRQVVVHQEGVKILTHLLDLVSEPVDELNRFINGCPLFAPQFKVRAEWNRTLGKVVLRDAK